MKRQTDNFRVSSCTVIIVTFVKLDPDSLAIFRKRSEGKLTSRIGLRGFVFVLVLIHRHVTMHEPNH